MSTLFDLITNPFSLSLDPIWEYIILAIIGVIAFRIAYSTVGELEIHGAIGSLFHWIIRFIVFVILWAITEGTIRVIRFLINNPIVAVIGVIIIFATFVAVFISKRKAGEEDARNEE